jgi:outer membrane protein assembly factor BamB
MHTDGATYPRRLSPALPATSLGVLVLVLLGFACPLLVRQAAASEMDAPSLLWRHPLAAAPNGIAVGEDAVFVALGAESDSTSPTVTALAAADGSVRWRGQVGDGLSVLRPAVDGETVVAVGYLLAFGQAAGGEAVAFDAATGAERWRVGLKMVDPLPPLATGGRVYVADGSGLLVALDGATGREVWRLEAEGLSLPIVDDEIVYLLQDEPQSTRVRLVALAAGDGTERWSAPIEVLPVTFPLAVAGETLYVAGFDGVEAFRVADGSRVAYRRAPTYYTPYHIQSDTAGPILKAEMPSDDRTSDWERSAVYALDGSSVVERWCTLVEDAAIIDPPLIAGETVLVTGPKGVAGLDRTSGEPRWHLPTGQILESAAESGVLYLAAVGGVSWEISAYRVPDAGAPDDVAATSTTGDASAGAIGGLESCAHKRVTQESVAGAAFGALLTVGFGGLFGWIAVRDLRRSAASRSNWLRTTGRITRSHVRFYAGAGHVALVSYDYSVDGTWYEGKRVRFLVGPLSRGGAEEIVARYPPNAEVEVYYDPDRPKHATLEPRHGQAALALCFAMSTVLLAMSVHFLLQQPWAIG